MHEDAGPPLSVPNRWATSAVDSAKTLVDTRAREVFNANRSNFFFKKAHRKLQSASTQRKPSAQTRKYIERFERCGVFVERRGEVPDPEPHYRRLREEGKSARTVM